MQSHYRPDTPSYGYWVLGTAFLVLMVLFVLPGTSRLARIQAGMLVKTPYPLYDLLKNMGEHEIPDIPEGALPTSAATDSDYADALVAALTIQPGESGGKQRRHRLEALLVKFPQHKTALYAHLLRYDTRGDVSLNRDAEVELYMTGKPLASPSTSVPSTSEALAAFDAAAAAGERADPNNAYFPLMRAVGLIAAHKDAEGLAEVERAGNRSRYEDYCVDEMDSRWKQMQRHGTPIALARMSAMYGLLFPHFAPLRAMIRFTTYKAVQAEVAGHKAEGFKIRQATMHFGKLMRTQARDGIGNLVGIAIEAIARSQPAGEKYANLSPEEWNNLSSEQHVQVRLDFYCTYLEQTGHPDAAEQARAENEAGEQTKSIVQKGLSVSPLQLTTVSQLSADWWLSMSLLANALAMLAFSIAMLALKMLKQDQGNQPLMVTGILCALLIIIAIRMDWAPALSSLRSALVRLGASDDSAQISLQQISPPDVIIRITSFCFSLLVPGIVLVALGIKRLVQGSNSRPVLARSLQTTGTIITLLLTLVYACVLFSTEQHEAHFHAAADRITQHEGKYYAELLGKTWPP